MGVSYGFSIPIVRKRERGYILISGLRTSHIAPIVTIGMSAPDWIKFLVSYVYNEKLDLTNPRHLNNLIYDRSRGLFFQGLKWRIQDPSDAAGYGIGINTLNRMGVLSTINPEKIIEEVSHQLVLPIIRKTIQRFAQIFTPKVIARLSRRNIMDALRRVASLPDSKRTFELVSITVDIIGEWINNRPISEQNDIAGTIKQFIRILQLMGVENWQHVGVKSPISLLSRHKPGNIPPHLSPLDIAVVLYELTSHAETGGLPVVLSFIVFDILGANRTASPEEILWEANYRLPIDVRIEQYVRKLYRRISRLIGSRGVSIELSEDDFLSLCSASEVRKGAIWWEYNLTIGKLEELMRDFVRPYRYQTPWSGKFKKELLRLITNQRWYRKANLILHKTEELANNVASKETYALIIEEETLLSWFSEIQAILSNARTIESRLKRLWEFSNKLSKLELDPVANYDPDTGTIVLNKDPREDNPFIQRSIVYEWLEDFGRIWNDKI